MKTVDGWSPRPIGEPKRCKHYKGDWTCVITKERNYMGVGFCMKYRESTKQARLF